MYSRSGFNDWKIEDITVIIHKALIICSNLIIPNHAYYIAHANTMRRHFMEKSKGCFVRWTFRRMGG